MSTIQEQIFSYWRTIRIYDAKFSLLGKFLDLLKLRNEIVAHNTIIYDGGTWGVIQLQLDKSSSQLFCLIVDEKT